MINSKEEMKEYISLDNNWLRPTTCKGKVWERIADYPTYELRRYLKYLRKMEYYINTGKRNRFHSLLGLFYERKKNKLGNRLGIEISPNIFGKGLSIYHAGNIVVNSGAVVGENCRLHGNNCIGNNGLSEDVPHIGNNVDIGFGAVIIGGIQIADNVVIGANAVVNHSILKEGTVVVGVPARPIISNKNS